MPIFTDKIINQIFAGAKQHLPDEIINKADLKKEALMFEAAMQHITSHPWSKTELEANLDTSSSLYKKIQQSFVGPDPEEDYKQVIVWKVDDTLYVTAAADHDPSFPVKWDVVVYEEDN